MNATADARLNDCPARIMATVMGSVACTYTAQDGTAHAYDRAAGTCTICTWVTCPTCEGAGEVGTRQDYWGNWDTETCRPCNGTGDVDVLELAEYRAECCPHGVHCFAPILCWECSREQAAENALADAWKATTRGGWDAPPPF